MSREDLKENVLVALGAALPACVPLFTVLALTTLGGASADEKALWTVRLVKALVFLLAGSAVGGIAALLTKELDSVWMRVGISFAGGFALTNLLYKLFYA